MRRFTNLKCCQNERDVLIKLVYNFGCYIHIIRPVHLANKNYVNYIKQCLTLNTLYKCAPCFVDTSFSASLSHTIGASDRKHDTILCLTILTRNSGL